ncbi:MAG: hypothetical protein INQ03_22120 [Candidatus Heimdallarchaeota archaeon]|nr:hypothetical protein [Candidatus Heimdallarchaeota archaeon]
MSNLVTMSKNRRDTRRKENPKVQRKRYNLSFNQLIKEFERIEGFYSLSEESYNDISKDDLTFFDLEIEHEEQYIEAITQLYHELLDPLFLSTWLIFPREYLNHLQTEAEFDHQIIAMNKLSEITQFASEEIRYEFPDTSVIPPKIFPGHRQYRSITTIIEHVMETDQKYDTLLGIIDALVDEVVDLIIKQNYDAFTPEQLLWKTLVFCEFERILPFMDEELDKDIIRENLLKLQQFAIEKEYYSISDHIGYYLESEMEIGEED